MSCGYLSVCAFVYVSVCPGARLSGFRICPGAGITGRERQGRYCPGARTSGARLSGARFDIVPFSRHM